MARDLHPLPTTSDRNPIHLPRVARVVTVQCACRGRTGRRPAGAKRGCCQSRRHPCSAPFLLPQPRRQRPRPGRRPARSPALQGRRRRPEGRDREPPAAAPRSHPSSLEGPAGSGLVRPGVSHVWVGMIMKTFSQPRGVWGLFSVQDGNCCSPLQHLHGNGFMLTVFLP